MLKATIDPIKIKKMNAQILTKYYYVMFKIVKQYPDSKLFQKAVNGILKLAHKIDSEVLVSVTTTL